MDHPNKVRIVETDTLSGIPKLVVSGRYVYMPPEGD